MLKKTISPFLASFSPALLFAAFLLLSFAPQSLQAHAQYSKPRIYAFNEKNRARADRHLKLGLDAFNCKRWQVAARHLTILTRDFHPDFYPLEVYYSLGLSFYHLDELDLANNTWSFYLQKETEPGHLDEVMKAKLDIAER